MKFLSFILSLLLAFSLRAQDPCFYGRPTPWADSVFATLSLDEKIGQLFMVAAWSNKDAKHINQIDSLVARHHIGGLIFFQGGPVRQAKLTNRYQAESKVPLLIAMDAEWGLGMRLDSTIAYPRQMTLGAMDDEKIIYEFGAEMARQLKRLGVHVSFSPVVDVNNNPRNPVISNRAFGEDTRLVIERSLHYMNGLQDNGVLAVAKHFPGHGDTDADSHKDLPVIPHPFERLDTLELRPYRELIRRGLSSVMVAHLYIPSLDSTPNLASTLSPKIIRDLLRSELGFDGLVFTDALNMQGVTRFWKPGEVDVKALLAGNDVLLYSLDVPVAIQAVKKAIADGTVTEKDVDQSVKRILRAKEWAGLGSYKPVEIAGLAEDLNNTDAVQLRRRIIEHSITVVKNGCEMIPVKSGSYDRIAVVPIGAGKDEAFVRTLQSYLDCDVVEMPKSPGLKGGMALHDSLSKYDLVIAAYLETSNKATSNFGITNEAARIINGSGASANVILAVFANPYSLDILKDLSNTEGLVVGYQDDDLTQQVAAEIIVGAMPGVGALPVTACDAFACYHGIDTDGGQRLRWVEPEYLGLKSTQIGPKKELHTSAAGDEEYREDMMEDKAGKRTSTQALALLKVDSIAMSGIKLGAYPGCRVLAAKDGQVFYDRSFGNLDWINRDAVTPETVYDLASITKVASSTLATMKLYEEGRINLDATLSEYLDIPEGNEYGKVVIRDMLAHKAGFTPWIPFYTTTMEQGSVKPNVYRTASEPGFSRQVAKDLYISDTWADSMFTAILNTPLSSDKSYKYSDLGYYFIQRIIEKQTGVTLDHYVDSVFYHPMGLKSMGYNPLRRMSSKNIAPTEKDEVFRKQTIRGYVHDQGAAMMGGVAGHAGLFSNARDLAAVMQMLLNGGEYAGGQLLKSSTIEEFNTCHFPGNRRGLGFDKPAGLNSGSTCNQASWSSFGHTGFTGTMCWADPETGIVFVFLSNRVHPDAENKKLQNLDIRTEIQAALYSAFGFQNRPQR